MPDGGAPKPRYEAVKDYVLSRIASGDWPTHARIPSENELGPMLGVSRITVNRAFAELAREGRLRKVPGVGTFVAEGKPRTGLTSIESIAEEIRGRGMEWSCEVLALGLANLTEEAADALGLPRGGRVPASMILHLGDALPIQLEERFIRPGYAPGYAEQDYAARTTYDYLREVGEVTEMEQAVTAILPPAPIARLLQVEARDPCLVIRRRTFRRGEATTFSRLTQPASRFELSGRYRMQDGPGGHYSF
ncbi:GntR family transcriptional regulator, histidine utilization repressor [Roseomonas rosea]|uniref:GntR family transcriptional regulator, histidine utilization repressor n=1 Tax=Muricoccus roseus TaxID=198092 RepID=A0A1M6H4L2_9PROT|nr:UTRA domain-containing protein [Roseomonas rosea]SHJ17086.1 GntR family transcriptional regulator, histidine utilization repressor [Roseomonas rosea]